MGHLRSPPRFCENDQLTRTSAAQDFQPRCDRPGVAATPPFSGAIAVPLGYLFCITAMQILYQEMLVFYQRDVDSLPASVSRALSTAARQ